MSDLNLEDLVSGTHLGHYVIVDRLAQGGMGTVFKAMEPALERYVAIKVLRPEYASNPDYVTYFQEEARAVAALRHPNIVPIYYIGTEGNVAFFSMAFIDGHTFDEWIERKRWFTVDDAKWFMRQAVSALSSAQAANIVHLDIKPANFLIDPQKTVMLTDFGLAQKIVKEKSDEAEREAFGTPAYVAPEQISREKTDHRTDMYSLGATLFHLMVGKPPFDGSTVEEIVWGHLEKPFPTEVARDAGLPAGWIYLIKKMMERDPQDRFQNYRELKDALTNVNSFHYETARIELTPEPTSTVVSVPRNGHNLNTLHGWLASDDSKWIVQKGKTTNSSAVQLNRTKVLETMHERLEPLRLNGMLNTLRDLCITRADKEDDLILAMEKVPGFDYAVRALAAFMDPEQAPHVNEEGLEIPTPPAEVLQVLGLKRARHLALIFFSLNYELTPHPNFDFIPLWRHSLTVAVIMDFMYDALDLRRSGQEFAVGFTHDIGKLILAELYPFAYFNAVSRAVVEELPLSRCEREIFGMDHTDMAEVWMRENGLPSGLIAAIGEHERPEKISRRATLTHALISVNHLVKQIGIGCSGDIHLGPHPWEELPSTRYVWEARWNKDYDYASFTGDFLHQFENFPDLI